jgi:hypothetical protein
MTTKVWQGMSQMLVIGAMVTMRLTYRNQPTKDTYNLRFDNHII